MEKEENYYGIKLNKKIPKIDKVNKFSKKIEFEFEGKAYVLQKNEEEIEKIEICNGYKLEKEGEYQIEFTNLKNEIYNLKIRIESNFLFIVLIFGFVVISLLSKSINIENYPISRIYDYINLTVLGLDINEEETRKYSFDVSFKNIETKELSLKNTINARSLAKNKIAPRCKWQFFNFFKCEK